MITLIGSRHSHANENRDMLRKIIRLNDYDHIFTEGLSRDAQKQSESHVKRLLEEKNFNGRIKEIKPEEAKELGRGPEPEFFEKSPLVDESSVTYLDDRDLEFLAETVLEQRDREDKSREGELMSHSQFEQKLIQEETTEEDFQEYFTGLMVEDELKNRSQGEKIPDQEQLDDQNIKHMNEQEIEMAYTAVSSYSRFQRYVEKVSERFASEAEEALEMLDNIDTEPEKYQDRFLAGIEKHNIDRATLQELLYNERDSQFQDERDQNWYSQIAEYIQENPRDDIVIIAGIQHVLPGENTLRAELEQEYSDTNVKPLDYQQN